jgi:hypothetical protein
LLLLAAAGCGVETDDRPASFAYIQTAILKPSCATAACHSSQNQREGLVLDDPETAFSEIQTTGITFDPLDGSPEDTGLILRLRGNLDGEERMPLDSPLPDADIALIARWIGAGGENN